MSCRTQIFIASLSLLLLSAFTVYCTLDTRYEATAYETEVFSFCNVKDQWIAVRAPTLNTSLVLCNAVRRRGDSFEVWAYLEDPHPSLLWGVQGKSSELISQIRIMCLHGTDKSRAVLRKAWSGLGFVLACPWDDGRLRIEVQEGVLVEPLCKLMPQSPAAALTFCVSPMFGDLQTVQLLEWIQYHRYLGVRRFVLYLRQNYSALSDMAELLPEVRFVYWPGWNASLITKSAGYYDQAHVYNHCLWRNLDSSWIGFVDRDEFLFDVASPYTANALTEFLSWHMDVAGLSLQSACFVEHSTTKQKKDSLMLERFIRRESYDHWSGRLTTKILVQPHLIDWVAIHNCQPFSATRLPLLSPVASWRVNHLRGACAAANISDTSALQCVPKLRSALKKFLVASKESN